MESLEELIQQHVAPLLTRIQVLEDDNKHLKDTVEQLKAHNHNINQNKTHADLAANKNTPHKPANTKSNTPSETRPLTTAGKTTLKPPGSTDKTQPVKSTEKLPTVEKADRPRTSVKPGDHKDTKEPTTDKKGQKDTVPKDGKAVTSPKAPVSNSLAPVVPTPLVKKAPVKPAQKNEPSTGDNKDKPVVSSKDKPAIDHKDHKGTTKAVPTTSLKTVVGGKGVKEQPKADHKDEPSNVSQATTKTQVQAHSTASQQPSETQSTEHKTQKKELEAAPVIDPIPLKEPQHKHEISPKITPVQEKLKSEEPLIQESTSSIDHKKEPGVEETKGEAETKAEQVVVSDSPKGEHENEML